VTILVSSSAFVEEGFIPAKYTCEGEDVSPPLRWSQPPLGPGSAFGFWEARRIESYVLPVCPF
jgi:hypothetical protein